jgi:hypothetical protein
LDPNGPVPRTYNKSTDELAALGSQVTCQRLCKEYCESLGEYAPLCMDANGNLKGDYSNSLEDDLYTLECK